MRFRLIFVGILAAIVVTCFVYGLLAGSSNSGSSAPAAGSTKVYINVTGDEKLASRLATYIGFDLDDAGMAVSSLEITADVSITGTITREKKIMDFGVGVARMHIVAGKNESDLNSCAATAMGTGQDLFQTSAKNVAEDLRKHYPDAKTVRLDSASDYSASAKFAAAFPVALETTGFKVAPSGAADLVIKTNLIVEKAASEQELVSYDLEIRNSDGSSRGGANGSGPVTVLLKGALPTLCNASLKNLDWAVQDVVSQAALTAVRTIHPKTVPEPGSAGRENPDCNGKRPPYAEIAACTAVIASGQFDGADLAVLYDRRGGAYFGKQDAKHAIADYTDAIRFAPEDSRYLEDRGSVYDFLKDHDRALQDYAAALALDPASGRAWTFQADTFYHMGKTDRALQSYAEGIKYSPDWNWPHLNRGELYLENDNYRLAIEDFDDVLRREPTAVMALADRCRVYAILGRLDDAIADCNRAIQLSPKFVNNMVASGDVPTYDDRALAQLKAGRLDAALADYNQALELSAKNPEALYGRGLSKMKKGDKAGAKVDIAAAESADKKIAARFAKFGVK